MNNSLLFEVERKGGRGAWVLFIHFLKKIEIKKKLLKGERDRGCEFFFFTFCYSFIIWKFFVIFVYS